MMKKRALVLMLAIFAVADAASAQNPVINPRAIRFTSADHTGDALKRPTSYAVDFFAAGASQPTQSPSVAASAVVPVPGTTPQLYEVTFAQLGSYPAGTSFVAKVRAINSAASSAGSNATDPFGQPVAPAAPGQAAVVP